MSGIVLVPLEEATGRDTRISVPDGVTEQLVSMFSRFWDKRAEFMSYGFAHKRGVLLSGPPGCGKSTVVDEVVARLVAAGGVAFLQTNDANVLHQGIQLIRGVEPERRILVVLEDLEQLLEYGEEDILDILDGSRSTDGIFFLCTTNNIGKLPARIVGRPGRIDRVFAVNPPGAAARVAFLRERMRLDQAEAEGFSAVTEGLSFADLREFIVSVRLFDADPAEAVRSLRATAAAAVRAESGDDDSSTDSTVELLCAPSVRPA
jgi:SpoVK/Ycf46/Vps4 family AAA+-type ATPase